MKKILLSITVIFSFLFYSWHQRTESSDEGVVVAPPPSVTSTPQPTSAPVSNGPLVTNTPPTSTTAPAKGQYRDGQYTGSVEDAFYGPYQVKAIVSGGKITDIHFLQTPNDRQTSIEINSQASPLLKQEAIQVQSAQVDIISGATQSSEGFQRSLQSALNQAKT